MVVQSSWFCWLVCHNQFVLMLERMNLTPLGGVGRGVCCARKRGGTFAAESIAEVGWDVS